MKTLCQLILSLWLAINLAHAETGMRVRQDGMLLTVEGSLATPVDAARAWRVLTDYARFPEFVPGIHGNRLVREQDGFKFVEQRGEVVTGAFRMAYGGILRIQEFRPDGLRIQFISGPFKDAEGEWRVQAGQPLRLSYRLRMDLMKSPFPPPLAPGIAEQQVRVWVEAFAREMEKPDGKVAK